MLTCSVSPNCGDAAEEGDLTLCPMGQDYVSVMWTGFFKPEFSETYTFWVESDDGARLYVEGARPIERWCSAAGPLDSCRCVRRFEKKIKKRKCE
jgi:hypothetical protein